MWWKWKHREWPWISGQCRMWWRLGHRTGGQTWVQGWQGRPSSTSSPSLCHRGSSPGGRTWVQGWLGRGGGRAAWRCRGSEILEEEVLQIQSPSLPGPPGYCHEDSGFPEIDFHVTRFQIMVPLPISIPRGNKNLTGHRIEGPNGKIGDYACWQCSRQVISHIKYPCTWQQQISNFPFPFSFKLHYIISQERKDKLL